MQSGFTALIMDYAGRVGLHLSREQADLCRMHIELMLEWNHRLNLTRITIQEETIVKHLLDSLLPATALPASGNALDVGTGAGFPGIPLKILHPGLEFTLLDASRKKVSFLAVVVAKLGLKGIHPVHGRWEDFAQAPGNRMRFSLITMRAVRLEPRHLSIL
ncbi:MAG: 16S rRNA (guanine(527)-N(7))-methyltransferase RsmG, partial [Syntrophobacter sp.]